jgi:hypothetical protein
MMATRQIKGVFPPQQRMRDYLTLRCIIHSVDYNPSPGLIPSFPSEGKTMTLPTFRYYPDHWSPAASKRRRWFAPAAARPGGMCMLAHPTGGMIMLTAPAAATPPLSWAGWVIKSSSSLANWPSRPFTSPPQISWIARTNTCAPARLAQKRLTDCLLIPVPALRQVYRIQR